MDSAQIYPDEKHGLAGVLEHLHGLMETFLGSCLGPHTLLHPPNIPYTGSDL